MRKTVDRLITILKWFGAFCTAGMMFLTCIDIVMRLAGRPLLGAVEFTGFLTTAAMAAALPYTHVMRSHVGVDLLVRAFPARVQAVVDFCAYLLAAALFAVITWQSFVYGFTIKKSGEVSMTLQFPAHIFVYVIGVAFGVLTLITLVDVYDSGKKAVAQ